MPAYSYTAATQDGSKTKGYIEADSAKLARAKLRQQSLFPIELEEIRGSASTSQHPSSPPSRKLKRISDAQLVMATRQLATLLQAQLNIEDSLTALIEQSDNERVQQVFVTLRREVRAGHALSTAISQMPHIFPDIYSSTVRAGEDSGQLATVIMRLSDYFEKRQELHQKITLAFAYPAMVSLVALVVIILLFIFVMPQVVQVFESTKQKLPLLTEIMLGISSLLRQYGVHLLVLLITAYFIFKRSLRLPAFRYTYDSWLLRVPVLNKVLLSGDAVRMASTLSILVGSGVPLLSAIRVCTDNLVLLPLKSVMQNIVEEVREGRSFSKALEAARRFPPVITYLVKNGEATGDMAGMLDRAAHQQQQELEARLNLLTTILGPLLIVGMGIIVGAIVLSVLLPIAEINQIVR